MFSLPSQTQVYALFMKISSLLYCHATVIVLSFFEVILNSFCLLSPQRAQQILNALSGTTETRKSYFCNPQTHNLCHTTVTGIFQISYYSYTIQYLYLQTQ